MKKYPSSQPHKNEMNIPPKMPKKLIPFQNGIRGFNNLIEFIFEKDELIIINRNSIKAITPVAIPKYFELYLRMYEGLSVFLISFILFSSVDF